MGVKDNGRIAGIRNEEDIFVVEQAAQMYCRPPQDVKVSAFTVDGGAVVLRDIECALYRLQVFHCGYTSCCGVIHSSTSCR